MIMRLRKSVFTILILVTTQISCGHLVTTPSGGRVWYDVDSQQRGEGPWLKPSFQFKKNDILISGYLSKEPIHYLIRIYLKNNSGHSLRFPTHAVHIFSLNLQKELELVPVEIKTGIDRIFIGKFSNEVIEIPQGTASEISYAINTDGLVPTWDINPHYKIRDLKISILGLNFGDNEIEKIEFTTKSNRE